MSSVWQNIIFVAYYSSLFDTCVDFPIKKKSCLKICQLLQDEYNSKYPNAYITDAHYQNVIV